MPLPVSVNLRTGKRGHLSMWSGQAFPTGDEFLTINSGSRCMVRLPDGDEGTVLVQNMAITSHAGIGTRQRLDLVGSGEPPLSLR